MNLKSYLKRFINEQDVKPLTKKVYGNGLRQFFKYLGKFKIRKPTRQNVLEYKEYMNTQGLKSNTRSNYLTSIRLFFQWASIHKIYENVAYKIKSIRPVGVHLKDPITVDEFSKIIKSIDYKTAEGKRDIALINLLTRSGLRIIEVARANYQDIETKDSVNRLWVQGKYREDKDQFIILTESALKPITEYIKTRKKKSANMPLFASRSSRNLNERLTTYSLSRIVKKHLKNIGIDSPRVTAHSLRHTFGQLAIQAGSSLYDTSLALRHSNVNTTQIYLKDIEQSRRLTHSAENMVDKILP